MKRTDMKARRTQTLEKLRTLHPDLPANATTEQLAQFFAVKPDSVRRANCVDGSFHGLVPVKLPTGRLVWPLG